MFHSTSTTSQLPSLLFWWIHLQVKSLHFFPSHTYFFLCCSPPRWSWSSVRHTSVTWRERGEDKPHPKRSMLRPLWVQQVVVSCACVIVVWLTPLPETAAAGDWAAEVQGQPPSWGHQVRHGEQRPPRWGKVPFNAHFLPATLIATIIVLSTYMYNTVLSVYTPAW